MLGIKPRYFLSSLTKAALKRGFNCPSCGNGNSDIVSRKYIVTTLRRCSSCWLLYRVPTSSSFESRRYYNGAYRSGLTTDMPDEARLKQYMETGFSGTEKCFGRYIAILRALGMSAGARILDYGCSWGYGSWQLQQAGFDAVGFDVSKARAAFAREKMGVRAFTEPGAVGGDFDAVFSAHVLEHVPSVAEVIGWTLDRLRPGGLLVAITPNGSGEYRARESRRWDRMWGYTHPNFLDAEFYNAAFTAVPHFISSRIDHVAEISAWAGTRSQRRGDLSGWELLAICVK